MNEGSSHLVIVGFDDIVSDKYLTCIERSQGAGQINGYTVIELDSQQEHIMARTRGLSYKPQNVYFVPDRRQSGMWSDERDFAPILQKLRTDHKKLKIYIATEVKAHEGYIRYCVEHGIESLVEKPVISPMRNGRFEASLIEPTMQEFVRRIKETGVKHSVMTLSRYHRIYNAEVLDRLREKMIALRAPLTSLHFRTAGGVWNLHREYESREDHPYKYGYGMLMHGAYHYVDLVSQCLLLNAALYPGDTLSMTISSFAAFPSDQHDRISRTYSEAFGDEPFGDAFAPGTRRYGETDVTSTYKVTNDRTGRTLTVGTISFEQTTPSFRSWKDIPEGVYNKNGRLSHVDLEAQLGPLYALQVQCFDIPVGQGGAIERMDAFARISTRGNAAVVPGEPYNSSQTFNGLFHSDSNRALIEHWLEGNEQKSSFESHLVPMRITQAIAESIQIEGAPVTIALI